MRALLIVGILLLAGCATPTKDPGSRLNNTTVQFVEDYHMSNDTTIPKDQLQNATLGPTHTHDAWGQKVELVLLDASIDAGTCEGTNDAIAYAFVTAASAQGPAVGCARLSLPEGVVVPEGTGALRVEIDATDALKNGGMELQWRDKAREVVENATTEKSHTWISPLNSSDWDIPHAKATTFVIYIGAVGQGAVLDGSLHARIVAQKLDGWQPILAIAHVDHWKLPALHDMPAPGMMRLLDGQANVTNIDPARFTGGDPPEIVPLHDIIAPGATHVTIVVDRTGSDCAPVLQCWLVPGLIVGGYERERFGNLTFEKGQRRVYDWVVPAEVPEDSVYANASTTQIDPRIDACTPDGTCGVASIASNKVSARLQVFAWDRDVDMDLLQTLAGPSR